MQINKNWIPFFLAVALGLAAMFFYIYGGRGSYDSGVRDLAGDGNVKEIQSADPKKVRIKCKNGENYEITFSEDLQSYDDLIFNACGPEGTQQQ